MKYPKKLRKGDTIGLICPSSPVTKERVLECALKIKSLGFNVKIADNVTDNYGGYMAGTGVERGYWVNKMFADEEVDGIFCIRGGDGSSRIMEYLDYEIIRSNPKVFVGYSDVTNLHLAINQNCGLVTFHGPMVSSNMIDSFDQETADSLFDTINAEENFEFKNPKDFDIKVLKEGKAIGRIIGGNLSLLSASIGTPYSVDTRGSILFIEEVSEPITKIEKWVYHLKNAGLLEKCSGILLGQFTNVVNDRCPKYDEIKCFEDFLDGLEIPVMYNIQSGHDKPMMTIPMGTICHMDTKKRSILFEVLR